MAVLSVYHSADPDALFQHAAEPLLARGPVREPLPLLVVRQGGLRDQLQERAAQAGCAGWLGTPVVVFAELPALLAADLAPLTAFERRAVLRALVDRASLREFDLVRHQRGFLDSLDRLFGDLVAERVAPARLRTRLASLAPADWEAGRDAELTALYEGYLDAIAALPSRDGTPRSDGRDDRTRAAEAVRERPDDVRRRLRSPFGDPTAARAITIYGLNDLRRGWDHLLDALRAAPFVDELRVYLLLDDARRTETAAGALDDDMERIGEHELLDALVARSPDQIVQVGHTSRPPCLAHAQRALFRPPGAPMRHIPQLRVRAIAAPDLARELEAVAGRVKRLIVEDGVPPHRISVVSRKSRPYGDRMAQILRRHGVPVTARLRTNLAEVPAVAALLRVFTAAADGFPWRTLADVAQSPYFDLDLDVGLLRRVGSRGRFVTLDGWERALDAAAQEAALERSDDDYRGPPPERARAALAAFGEFRRSAEVFARARTRSEWIRVALRALGWKARSTR